MRPLNIGNKKNHVYSLNGIKEEREKENQLC